MKMSLSCSLPAPSAACPALPEPCQAALASALPWSSSSLLVLGVGWLCALPMAHPCPSAVCLTGGSDLCHQRCAELWELPGLGLAQEQPQSCASARGCGAAVPKCLCGVPGAGGGVRVAERMLQSQAITHWFWLAGTSKGTKFQQPAGAEQDLCSSLCHLWALLLALPSSAPGISQLCSKAVPVPFSRLAQCWRRRGAFSFLGKLLFSHSCCKSQHLHAQSSRQSWLRGTEIVSLCRAFSLAQS